SRPRRRLRMHSMTGPDPTERMQTPPPAAEPPPPTPPPPASPTPPPASPTPPSAAPTSPPAWQPPPADHGGGASFILGIIILAIGAWFFATQTLGLDLPD